NIRFELSVSSFAELNIYDAKGELTENLLGRQLTAGSYELNWNAAAQPSGVYFCIFKAGDFSETRKMILIK
ncbi:MAG TPA: T9SS type A sorting domain-containing protein, partial [Ignavibacteria bacterium]|nr:T9SS type A sorting domain-containing protein [Ignavibacteria bacterium]